MKANEKRDRIKALVQDLLNDSHAAMMSSIDKAIDSGAIDVDSWDEAHFKMVLPKCIAIAILQNESEQHEARGSFFEKRMKKDIKNIKYFL